MNRYSVICCAVCVLAVLKLSWSAESPADSPNDLATAIAAFNAKSLESSTGKDQPPLTEDEVLGAIRLAERADNRDAPDAQFLAFKRISQTRQLPPKAEIEVLTGIDPGADYVFDVWYVRIRLPKDDGGSYGFTIRNRVIRARPVAEVAQELEKDLQDIPPMPGRYRLEDRLKNLKERAAKAATQPAMP